MEKMKLMIADNTETFCSGLEAMLQDEFDIQIANSGHQALDMLNHFAPDVMILDVMLSGLDGIGVLEYAARHGYRPKVLVTTLVHSDYIFAKLAQLEVSYVLMKPCCLRATVERIREIAATCHEVTMTQDGEQKLANILLELGINPKHNGYHYLCSAVKIYNEDNTQSLTKELYVAVGASYGVSWQQVERSIRGALDAAWRQREEKIWRRWFPSGSASALRRPTNGEVICRLSEYLRLEQLRKIG